MNRYGHKHQGILLTSYAQNL